jgi:hypothetical protein
MKFILYQSNQETQNYVERLSLEQIKEMLMFQTYPDELKQFLLKEYVERTGEEMNLSFKDD